MDVKKKSIQIGGLFLTLLVVSGLLLTYQGNDAIALAVKKKDGILTAEQVKVAFDSVGGRLVNEAVKEAQEVKQGDIMMMLDSTDVDLAIEKLKTQISQMEAQIQSLSGTIQIGYERTNTNEKQNFRQIDQQRAAVNSVRSTYENQKLDYNRKAELFHSGAISRAELDNAQTSLDVAEASVTREEQALAKLLAGVADNGNTDALLLPSIAQERAELSNRKNDLQSLVQQKKSLEIQLKQLEIQKDRLTLRAPEDGRILKILAKQGEMISPNTPVILLESKRYYYDIYISEEQVAHLSEGSTVTGRTVATKKEAPGTVRLVTAAPGFADLKMTREKGQADLAAFQVRIYTEPQEGLLPGMTIEVAEDAFTEG